MAKKKKKNQYGGDVILRAQTTRYYAVPEHLQQNLSRLIEDWFYRHDMHSHHASREAHEIGYSEMVTSVSPISYEEYERGIQEKIIQRKKLKDICQWCREPKDDVKKVEMRWGPDGLAHPLRYKICPECRMKLEGWFDSIEKEEKDDD